MAFKIAEWQGGSGNWYTGYIQISGDEGKWWYIPRKLGMPLTDYIEMLKSTYKARIKGYCKETDILVFSFDNYGDAHKYVLYINRMARNGGW